MNEERRYWVGVAERLATPVLEALAARRLKSAMPVESAPGAVHREHFPSRSTRLAAHGPGALA